MADTATLTISVAVGDGADVREHVIALSLLHIDNREELFDYLRENFRDIERKFRAEIDATIPPRPPLSAATRQYMKEYIDAVEAGQRHGRR